MRDQDILREEIGRAIEANRHKSLLQIHFEERRKEIYEAFEMAVNMDTLARLQTALHELKALEAFINEVIDTGKLAQQQLEQHEKPN